MLDDGFAQGMLRVAFGGGEHGQQILRGGPRRRKDLRYDGRAGGQRPRLVEDDRTGLGERLQVCAVLDEGPRTCHARDRGEHGQRRARRDSTGPGHDDHRDGGRPVARHGERDGRAGQRQVDEVGGEPVGEPLHRGLRGLGPPYGLDDAPVGGVGSDPLGPDLQGADPVDRAGVDRLTGGDVDRQRLAGDAGLIDGGAPRRHGSVHRNPAARRDHDHIARPHLGQGEALRPIAPPDPHCLGQEGHEVGQGVPAAVFGEILEDLGGQHEGGDHQGRHPFADGAGRDDGDEHRQLHAHLPVAQILPRLGGDRPAADRQPHDGHRRPSPVRPGRGERRHGRAQPREEGSGRVRAVDPPPDGARILADVLPAVAGFARLGAVRDRLGVGCRHGKSSVCLST